MPNVSSLITLPKSIGLLTKLETLNLGGSSLLVEVPAEIGGLSSFENVELVAYTHQPVAVYNR